MRLANLAELVGIDSHIGWVTQWVVSEGETSEPIEEFALDWYYSG